MTQIGVSAILILALLGVAVIYAQSVLGYGNLWGISHLFNLDEEGNLPSWFSSTLIALCAVTLGGIAWVQHIRKDRCASHWKSLAFIFVYLSMDEGSGIHEIVARVLWEWLHPRGMLMFAWVIAAIPLVTIFLLGFWRFLANLDSTTRWNFVAAGTVFVGAALGLELVEGAYASAYGFDVYYRLLTALEDPLEMLGMLMFLRALLVYLSENLVPLPDGIRVTVG